MLFLTPPCAFQTALGLSPPQRASSRIVSHRRRPPSSRQNGGVPEYDAIIIGSGLGGLSTAALLSAYGRRVIVLEAHTEVGGAAHSFYRRTEAGIFKFESGPHLFSGLSTGKSSSRNPMRDVLRAADVQVEMKRYDRWGVLLGDTELESTIIRKSRPFLGQLMRNRGGPNAETDIAKLMTAILPMGELASALSPALLRAGDIMGSLVVAGKRAIRPGILRLMPHARGLTRPFSEILGKYVTDPFARDFMNLLCFLLAGVEADRIPTAEMAYMLREWTGDPVDEKQGADGDINDDEDAVLEHPVGGASGLAKALVDTIRVRGSVVRTRARVQRVLLQDGAAGQARAIGVQLATGESIYGAHVVSNASAPDTALLLPGAPGAAFTKDVANRPLCSSFMHVHAAIPLTTSVLDKIPGGTLLPNYVSVEDFGLGLEAAGNIVLVSVPSVLDPAACPPGYAVVHAYTPATEPYAPWAALDRRTDADAYAARKERRAEPLWRAISRAFGQDVRSVASIQLIGTPLTHARYLQRRFGSYGPRVDASSPGPGLGLPFPGADPLLPQGLCCVGDSVFPGVGVPAVAGSAWIVANGLVSVAEHEHMLRRIGM